MNSRIMQRRIVLLSFFVLFLSGLAAAQDVASFEKRITVKKLPNGLTIMICERPEAPVFSFFTMVDAGSAQDPMAKTGLAHMFEHMAFKGTDKIGTNDYAAEKPALAKVETAYAAYIAERDKPVDRDDKKLAQLEQSWKDAIAAADKFSAPYNNEFGKIVESEGGEGGERTRHRPPRPKSNQTNTCWQFQRPPKFSAVIRVTRVTSARSPRATRLDHPPEEDESGDGRSRTHPPCSAHGWRR